MGAVYYVGDAIETMNRLPEKSVDLILTSPPFLALRSYLPADHPLKSLEGGSQATPGAYIDWLVDVVEACARVLAPHGSLVFELGDTYCGARGYGTPEDAIYGERHERLWETSKPQRQFKKDNDGWPLSKSLSLIPELFRLTLVYGQNPLTGRTTERWRLRNVIRWVRPNPPVGALGDKFRPATSELMVFCKSAKRFFDLDAVRGGFAREYRPEKEEHPKRRAKTDGGWATLNDWDPVTSAGAPPLDWWNIPPGGYQGAHYAVWPPELCVKPIKAMSPEKVCRVCGEPSRRIVGEAEYINSNTGRPVTTLHHREGVHIEGQGNSVNSAGLGDRAATRVAPTLGFSDCGHDNYRPGLVLDPFAGSGTTLAVATGHGRDAVGIDLDARNYDLALERVGPFLLELAEM